MIKIMKGWFYIFVVFIVFSCSYDITNKEIVINREGCFISHQTKGEISFRKKTENLSPMKAKVEFIKVLKADSLYHLHDYAALKLLDKGLIGKDSVLKLVVSSRIFNDETKHFFNLQGELIDRVLDNNDDLNHRRYYLKALYSRSGSMSNGASIFKKINQSDADKSIKQHNNSLYESYLKYKPNLLKLHSIETWMEMDKNIELLEEVLTDYHPLVFNDILYLNPSTLLDSKGLCKLKKKAIETMIKESSDLSFYSCNKLTYLKEMLVYENYSIKFLELIVSKSNFKSNVQEVSKM